jgi:hypothetical protein
MSGVLLAWGWIILAIGGGLVLWSFLMPVTAPVDGLSVPVVNVHRLANREMTFNGGALAVIVGAILAAAGYIRAGLERLTPPK